MIGRTIFNFLSRSQKIAYLQEKGIALGTRIKNGRKAYLYMIKDFCVEVIFQHDNEEMNFEKITTFPSVKEFNNYLEREFRAAF